jgi:GNAT superfamily N-acetyltransferase
VTSPAAHDEGALVVRPATRADRDAVLRLLSASLGWVPDELFGAFFSWKHEEGPFGTSPAWVAVDGKRVVGFRTFVRWEFDHPDGRTRRAVRAVDTATHPDHQGRGIFRRLTLHGVDAMRAEGVDMVFNTPNAQSRPGYLRMGWSEVGRLPASVRPTSPAGARRMLGSRVPADRWSLPSDGGVAAPEALAGPGVEALLAALPPTRGLRTRRTAAHLRWRYGFEPLRYRAVSLAGDPAQGLAVFRLRRRGPAVEAALCEVLVPGGEASAARALGRAVARTSGADYVIRLGGPLLDRTGFVRLPGQGPVLTWRPVAAPEDATPPPLADWQLALGDVELF